MITNEVVSDEMDKRNAVQRRKNYMRLANHGGGKLTIV